jgi:hypothetical protein
VYREEPRQSTVLPLDNARVRGAREAGKVQENH